MADEAIVGLDAFDTTAAADEGAVMEVRSPKTGEVLTWPDGRPWTVTFYGADSDRVIDAARKMADRNNAAAARTRQPKSVAATEKDGIELLMIATKSWDIPLGDGSPAKNDPKEYRAAYAKYKWLTEQGDAFVGTRANFLKA